MAQSKKQEDTQPEERGATETQGSAFGKRPDATSRSGEYRRASSFEARDDLTTDAVHADVEAAVQRMQKQLGEDNIQEAVVPSARFKIDGSIVPAPRESLIRELRRDQGRGRGREEALDYDGDDQTALDARDDDAFADDDAFVDDDTTPSKAISLKNHQLAYDPPVIDEIVQFHEGPTHLSGGTGFPGTDSSRDERLHPWFDGGAAEMDRQKNQDFLTSRINHPRIPAAGRPDLRVRAPEPTLSEWMNKTVEVKIGHVLLALGGFGLLIATASIAWLIASP